VKKASQAKSSDNKFQQAETSEVAIRVLLMQTHKMEALKW